jgi:hypothetical protein
MASIPGEIADAVVAAIKSPAGQAELLTLATSGETAIETLIVNGIAALPSGTGILALVLPTVKSELEAEVKTIVSTYTPAEIVTLLTNLASDEATSLGG